jgi:hypothetical protein
MSDRRGGGGGGRGMELSQDDILGGFVINYVQAFGSLRTTLAISYRAGLYYYAYLACHKSWLTHGIRMIRTIGPGYTWSELR